jgi:hypothetical protein
MRLNLQEYEDPGRPRDCILVTPPLERLAQALQDMAAELGQFIQEAHAMVGQCHFASHGHVASADQPHIRDGVMGGAKGARGDQGGAGAGEASDAVDAGVFNSFGHRHCWQDGGEPVRQHQLAGPRRAEQ